eukprot:GHRR01035429.1.p1 GENE.GHRR01035429.1~~GHRR01035429.1.p1  ORF type:complete len:132 (-),score=7.59 GHRR01035429.1:1137-1532(-)
MTSSPGKARRLAHACIIGALVHVRLVTVSYGVKDRCAECTVFDGCTVSEWWPIDQAGDHDHWCELQLAVCLAETSCLIVHIVIVGPHASYAAANWRCAMLITPCANASCGIDSMSHLGRSTLCFVFKRLAA